MNIASNPWSFDSGDVLVATPTASPNGLVLNADGTVTLATGVAHGFVAQDKLTVIDATNPLYNGYYIAWSASGTAGILVPQFTIPAGTAGSGGGTIAKCLYNSKVRIEDISWQNPTTAGQILDLRDREGHIIWQATAQSAGNQNRGKLFWVAGITPVQIDSGVVLMTIN